MTDQPYQGATPAQLRHPQVREFLAVHNMFRNYLAELLDYVDGLLAGQSAMSRPEALGRYRMLSQATYQYTQMLHHHHHLESAMLFPSLRQEGLAESVIERLEAEHAEIAGLITRLDASMENAAALDAKLVDEDLRRLAEGLRAHLAYEETHVCPVLVRFKGWPI